MVNDYKKHDLFGKTLMQKIALTSPFSFDFPVTEQACFLYVLQGELQCKMDNSEINISANYSFFLDCITSGKQIHNSATENNCEIVIVTFYPDILKKIKALTA